MGYLKTQADASRVPFNEGGNLLMVEDITEAKTLTAEDSGKLFILKAAAGAQIDIPLVKGFYAKFRTGLAFATTDWTLVSATNVIQGNLVVNGAAVPASNENTISFVATAESLGDEVTVESDGTNIYVSGVGNSVGSITATAP